MNNKKNLITINIIFIPIIISCIISAFLNQFNLAPLILALFFLIVYVIFLYGEITISRNSNPNNLYVQSDGTNLIIDYKNDRFSVPIDSFNYLDEAYKKATGKTMNVIVKEGLVNYLKREYWYFIKKIPRENLMSENNVLNYFSNIRNALENDKNFLLNYISINKLITSTIPTLFICIISFIVLCFNLYRSFLNDKVFTGLISLLIILVILAIMILTLKKIINFINFSKRIKNDRVYICECQIALMISGFPKDTIHDKVFEFKYLRNSKHKKCSEVIIKSSSNYYLNRWFVTSEKIHNNVATLYIINNLESNKNEFILITK